MQQKQLKLTAALLFSAGMLTMQAQSTIPASGGNASGSGGTASYTVGQVVYTTSTGGNGSVAQGVQHPYEISVMTGIDDAKDISLEIIVYPNPASDYVKLKVKNLEIENLSYKLYNLNGSILLDSEIHAEETDISMQTLLSSTYVLKVIQGQKEVKTFKIIKN